MTATATRRRRRQPAAADALTDGALLASSSSGRVAGELRHLPLNAIDPGLNTNPRGEVDTTSDTFAAFLESIRASGVLQPVGAHPHPDDPERVALTMGWRRYTAATIAELDTIPVYVTALRGSALVRAIAENSAREDLTQLQEAHAIKTLMDEEGLTQVEAGKLIGRSERTVRSRLQLLKLTPKVAAAIDDGSIPSYVAPTMQRLGEACPRAAERLADQVKKKNGLDPASLAEEVGLRSALEGKVQVLDVNAYNGVRLDQLPKGEAWADLHKAYKKVPKDRWGGKPRLTWSKGDVDAARKAGVAADVTVRGRAGTITLPIVEDEAWLQQRIGVVIERAAKRVKRELADERKRVEAQKLLASNDEEPDAIAARAAAAREMNARFARTQLAAHEMNLEVGDQLRGRKIMPMDAAAIAAVIATERDAFDAAASAAYLIDPSVQTFVLEGSEDPHATLTVPECGDARDELAGRIYDSTGMTGAALLACGAIAALWVDPRAVKPERDLTDDGAMRWWRLPAGPIRTAVADYAQRAGITPPDRALEIDRAIAAVHEQRARWEGTAARVRILHELEHADGQLTLEKLERRCGQFSGDLPDAARRGPVSDPHPYGGTAQRHAGFTAELTRLIEDELVGVEPGGEITITTLGVPYLADPPAWPELRDVDADLPLVYPPGAGDQDEDGGELALEGRTRGEQALSAIRHRPGITIPELAEVLGVKQNYMYRVLPALEQDGKVVKRDRGWHATEEGTTDA